MAYTYCDPAPVINALTSKLIRSKKYGNAIAQVGYRAAYALFVHEDLEAVHPIGEAKYLEKPARRNREKYASLVRRALRAGMTMAEALELAGQALLEDSQEIVPYDTGFLHDSGFVEIQTI